MEDNNTISNTELAVLEIFTKFYETENIGMAVTTAIGQVCELFEINSSCVTVRNDVKRNFLKILSYTHGKGIEVFQDAMTMAGKFSNIHTYSSIDSAEEDYINLFNGKSFCHVKDFKSVENIFANMGYETSSDEVFEIFMHYTKIEDYFAYTVFEKHTGASPFTQFQMEMLTTLCRIMQGKVEKVELIKLLKDERNFKEIILKNENMPICIIAKDTHKVVSFNELYKQLLPNIVENEVCPEVIGKTISCLEQDVLEQNDNVHGKYWLKKSIPFTLGNGMDVYLIYAKDTEDYVNQLSSLDLLTSSLSLKGLTNYYNMTIRKSNHDYVLVTLDIDKFKYINNTFGYEMGDEILQRMANTLRNFVSDDEMFCRINEDKFAVILKLTDIESVNDRFTTLKNKLRIMQETYFVDKRLNFMGGITTINKNLEFNILLDQANLARKSVKGAHSSSFALYDAKVERNFERELILEKRTIFAVKNNEFVPYLQPKFDLATKKICGAEALVRWITPDGMIFPDEFIPLFEKNGFILNLDFIIYEKVMKYIRECIDNGLPVYPISLNVSRNHIQDKSFIIKIMKLIDDYKIPLDTIELEVTESVFVEDKAILKKFIDTIKEKNIKVSIDDFGTAYSSLHVLTDINVDVIKIDKSFLDNIHKNNSNKDKILLKNIVNLASELNFKVICEGVETDEQIEILRSIGCEYGQGYVFARPMPIEDYQKQFLV